MTITFCGAAQEVTGSAHLITLDSGFNILLDCGLYQGRSKDMADFNSKWLFDPKKLDCLILSHAHIDHTGRVPKLVKDGFRGEIHATHATRSLAHIMLLDSAAIQEKDARYYEKKFKGKDESEFQKALYTKKDVHIALQQFNSHSYDHWFKISDEVEALFKDAGHILGSASVTLKIKEGHQTTYVGFTGDIGRPYRPILRDPVSMPPVDYLITESTYGDKIHENAPNEKDRFLSIINDTCLKRKGKVIIPAFSIGRTQEIVYLLDQLETEGLLPKIPIYVDSPLAVNATKIFGAHPECFDEELNDYLLVDLNPFGFNDLKFIQHSKDSKALNGDDQPSIIISSSGMMNAGRVRHHLFHAIDNEKNTILIVGYCAPGTPGAILMDGKDKIKLFGQWKQVKAKIEVMDSFSAHADQLELLDFLKNQRNHVKKIFLVHGTRKRQEKFQEKLNQVGFGEVIIPSLNETIDLKTAKAEKHTH